MEINLEVGGIAVVWSSTFVSLRLYYVRCSIVVYYITFC
jgi:hypothetical protein